MSDPKDDESLEDFYKCVAEIYSAFERSQEPLDDDIIKIIFEKLEDLYEN